MNTALTAFIAGWMATNCGSSLRGFDRTYREDVSEQGTFSALVEGQSWLLIIAVNDYESWPDLQGPRNDAASVKEQLFRKYGFFAAKTIELYDGKATNAGIRGALLELQKDTGPRDRLLIYYAGHGVLESANDTGYWVPYDGGPDKKEPTNWITHEEIKGYINGMRARNVLLIVDSCFSGEFILTQRGETSNVADLLKYRSRQVMTSASMGPAFDRGEDGHSVFASRLIKALRENRNRHLLPHSLFEAVEDIENQTPRFGSLAGRDLESTGSYVFIYAPAMVKVPAGRFRMGCAKDSRHDCDFDEGPQREESLPSFWIDRTEVTVDAYKTCVEAGDCSATGVTTPLSRGRERSEASYLCNWNGANRDLHPMNCVDWSQAEAYCRWANKRLPTEQEWERAARGRDGSTYPWGEAEFGTERFANILDRAAASKWRNWRVLGPYNDGYPATAPVGSFSEGTSLVGAQDMVGNVAEWVTDWYREPDYRSVRGSSWISPASRARVSVRLRFAPSDRLPTLGFRCARGISED